MLTFLVSRAPALTVKLPVSEAARVIAKVPVVATALAIATASLNVIETAVAAAPAFTDESLSTVQVSKLLSTPNCAAVIDTSVVAEFSIRKLSVPEPPENESVACIKVGVTKVSVSAPEENDTVSLLLPIL